MNRPRLSAVAALAAAALWLAPAAGAVSPPVVDPARLPGPATPAPPWPTVRHEPCVATGGLPAAAAPGTQLADLGLDRVWPLTRGAGQTVAIIDTGVARHRLLPRLIGGGDYVTTGDGTADCDGHGTLVAGIVGAAPEDGFGGIAPEATLIAIRQSSVRFRAADAARGTPMSGVGDVETLARAVRTAADMGATVINISTVACLPAGDGMDDAALGAALAYAVDVKNAVVVAAAGNVGPRCGQNPLSGAGWDELATVTSPGWYDDHVLTVGSVAPDGSPSAFTLAGPWVDVAAPGEGVVSLDPGGEGLIDTLPGSGEPAPIAGTSYAAPVVAGIVALVRARRPELTARQVMRLIEDTARRPPSGWNPVVGHGIVDAVHAVTGGRPDTPAVTAAPLVVAPPAAPPRDGRTALRIAAVCVGAALVVAVTERRRVASRRGRDGVALD